MLSQLLPGEKQCIFLQPLMKLTSTPVIVGKLTEARKYKDDNQHFLEDMMKEALTKRPDDVKSFLTRYLGQKTPQSDNFQKSKSEVQ